MFCFLFAAACIKPYAILELSVQAWKIVFAQSIMRAAANELQRSAEV